MDQKAKSSMSSLNIRNILFVTIAAAITCAAAPPRLAAAGADASANITFTLNATFATPAISGADQLELAGQPFTISIVADSSLRPNKHEKNWAVYYGLKMNGVMYTERVPNTPITIHSPKAAIAEFIGSSEDIFQSGFRINDVVGYDIETIAKLVLPGGTLSTDLIRPFPKVVIDPTGTTVTYKNAKNPTEFTVLGIQSATLVGTLPK
jgi:hypothetical protein